MSEDAAPKRGRRAPAQDVDATCRVCVWREGWVGGLVEGELDTLRGNNNGETRGRINLKHETDPNLDMGLYTLSQQPHIWCGTISCPLFSP